VLRSGRLVLEHLRSEGQPASAQQQIQHDAALDQLKAARMALCLLGVLSEAGQKVFLATTAAPSVSIPWLEALLDVLVGMPRAAWGELGWRRSPAGLLLLIQPMCLHACPSAAPVALCRV
jgi:hypothetical protein